jgi:hypothetical protein
MHRLLSLLLSLAIGFAAIGFARRTAWPAALSGAGFLALHALVHVTDALAGREELHHGGRPADRDRPARSSGWLARLVAPGLDAFERRHGYDTRYIREIAAASPSGFVRFALATMLGDGRSGVPIDAWYAVKLVAIRHEDCGPCTQLVVRMAEEEGVPVETIRAVLERRGPSAPEVTLAVAFAEAALARDLVTSDRLRPEIVARWGPAGLVAIARALANARMYPTIKYALGHGRACSRVTASGGTIDVAPREAT